MKRIKYFILCLIMIFSFACSNSVCEENELEFRMNNGVLEWKYTSDSEWKVAADLFDANKSEIDDGNIELRVNENYLEWKKTDNDWMTLFDLSTLKGTDGNSCEFEVKNNKLICKYSDGNDIILFDFSSISGINVQEIQLQVDNNKLKWKYTNDENWKELYDFSIFDRELKLEIKDNKLMYGYDDNLKELLDLDSLKGEDGREIEFEVYDNVLMYGYNGETKKQLFDFDSLIINDSIDTEFIVENYIFKCKKTDTNEWIDLVDFKELLNEINVEINIDDILDIDITEKVQNSISSMISVAEKSVMGIANYEYNDNNQLVKSSIGSGFVYKVEGLLSDGKVANDIDDENIIMYKHYIITNRHVVLNSDEIKVYIFEDDKEYDAELIKYDLKDDLALIAFTHDKYIKPLKLGDSQTVKTGDFVIAIGNPEGFDYSNTATLGIVSYPNRYVSVDTDDDNIDDWNLQCIQHDCAINPGNSGGPLLNIYGEVIGVNTLKFATTEIDNMGFSIAVDSVKHTVSFLEKGEVAPRIVLGITIIAVRDVLGIDSSTWQYDYNIPKYIEHGLYITSVTEGSIAEGVFEQDDILLEFNSSIIRKALDLKVELNKFVAGSGDEIKAIVLRDGSQIEVVLKLK